VEKQLNLSKCRLGFGHGWVHGSMYWVGMHIGTTWQIPLNRSVCGGDAACCQITLTTRYY